MGYWTSYTSIPKDTVSAKMISGKMVSGHQDQLLWDNAREHSKGFLLVLV